EPLSPAIRMAPTAPWAAFTIRRCVTEVHFMSPADPPRASQSFVEKAGEAWARLQDRTASLIDPLGRIAIERLRLVAGERVVDVGCGCGQTLLQLAERVGPSGQVLGVDISPPMLAVARDRVAGRPTIALAL